MKQIRVFCMKCKEAHVLKFPNNWVNYTFKCFCETEIFMESKVAKQYEEFAKQLEAVNNLDDFLNL